MQTMYANKNRSLATSIDDQASIDTPEAESGTASRFFETRCNMR